MDSGFITEQIADLDIQLVTLFLTYKVDLLCPYTPDTDLVSPAEQFKAHDVFQNDFHVLQVCTDNCLPQPVIGHIVFLIDFQYLLAVDVLALETVQKIGFLTGFQIVQNRFRSYGAVLRLEVFGDAGG